MRSDIVTAHARVQQLAMSGGGLALLHRGRRPAWPHTKGALVLLGWTDERLPLAALLPRAGGRRAHLLASKGGGASPIDSLTGVSLPVGLWHVGLEQFGAGGVSGGLDRHNVQTVYVASNGAAPSLLPPCPSGLAARRVAGDKPRVTWVESRFEEQAAPSEFRVFVRDAAGPWTFGAPAVVVPFTAGKVRYAWTGAALNAGDVRYYTVRAATAGGVLSLIPRLGAGPSPDYDDVAIGHCPRVEIGAPAPGDPGAPTLEVP